MSELDQFRKSITAPTPFKSLVDLIPTADKVMMYADELSTKNRQPLKYPQLQSFIQGMDLRKYGIGREDTVCTAMPNGSEAATCFWALADQCVFAPLNPALTVAEIEFELLDLPCHTMIMMKEPEKYYANAPSSAIIEESCKKFNVQVLWLTPDPQTVGLFTLSGGDGRKAADKDECAAEHLALVLHTSGTTKKPKIVPLTHSNLAHGIQFVAATLRRQQADLNLNVMPLFHIHGLIANVGVSTYSAAPFIASSFFGGADFCDKLNVRGKVPTWYSAVPTMHEAILLEGEKRGKDGLKHSLTLMRNCSAALLPPVSKRFLKAFGTELGQPFTVVPTYAMTESFPICSNPPDLEVKLSTVGPAMGPNIKILNGHPDDTEVANVGDEGEVCVKGQCVTAGYLMREHMSADPNIEAYTTKDSPVGKMLRTGDKGYCDSEGYMQLVGRFKEIINCGGEKISPLEMEDQLLTNVPSIETCVCFACPADMLGEIVGVACVTKAGSAYPTLEQVREGLPQTMARFKPRVLVIMDAIPKGPTGKPKRIGLAQMLKIPAIEVSADAVYRVEGKDFSVAGLQPTQRLAALWGAEVATLSPVWDFPLTISLHVSPDLGDYHRTEHVLKIEDSLCNEFKLDITTFAAGCPVPIEFPITREEVFEALNYVRDRTHEYGMDWTAKIGENGRYEDWCSTLTVSDPGKTMVHQWDLGCSDTPPGKLIRLLKLLDCGHGTEAPPDYDPSKEPPPPNWPGPKGDSVPVS